MICNACYWKDDEAWTRCHDLTELCGAGEGHRWKLTCRYSLGSNRQGLDRVVCNADQIVLSALSAPCTAACSISSANGTSAFSMRTTNVAMSGGRQDVARLCFCTALQCFKQLADTCTHASLLRHVLASARHSHTPLVKHSNSVAEKSIGDQSKSMRACSYMMVPAHDSVSFPVR